MSALRGRRVLVTGATGFIGARVAAALAEAGAELHITVRASSAPARLGPLWERARRHRADLSSADALAAVVAAVDPEYVFHLAKEREGASFEREVAATLRLAEALRGAKRLRVWVRTALAAREKFGRQGDAYVAKMLAEKYRLPIVTLELFQVYGPGQGAGDFPTALIRETLAGRAPRPETVGGAGKQDFVYVDDVAAAYVAAATAEAALGKTVPIGSGVARGRGEVANRVLEKMDALAPGTGAPPEDAAGGHAADAAQAERLLGWRSATPLDRGLDRVIAWCRENPKE